MLACATLPTTAPAAPPTTAPSGPPMTRPVSAPVAAPARAASCATAKDGHASASAATANLRVRILVFSCRLPIGLIQLCARLSDLNRHGELSTNTKSLKG